MNNNVIKKSKKSLYSLLSTLYLKKGAVPIIGVVAIFIAAMVIAATGGPLNYFGAGQAPTGTLSQTRLDTNNNLTLDLNAQNWFNETYNYRKLLTITATDALPTGATVKADLDLAGLVDNGKLRPDLKDLRLAAYNRSAAKFETCNAGGTTIDDTTKTGVDIDVPEGQAISFDGVDDYIEVADSAGLSITGVITVEAWIKTDLAQGSTGVITKGPAGGDYDYMLYFTGGPSVNFYVTDSTGAQDNIGSITFNYADNQWHHYAAVFDGNFMYLYIDGVLKSSKDTVLTNIRNSVNKLRIMQGWGKYFKGAIDEVRVSNLARYDAAGKNIGDQVFIPRLPQFAKDANTAALYHFDGSSIDASGNGNQGAMVNGPIYAEGKVVAVPSGIPSDDSGLAGLWKFDAGFNDYQINSAKNNGTAYGNAAISPEAIAGGGALTLDGAGDYLEAPDAAALDTTTAITIEAWIYPFSLSAWDNIVFKGAGQTCNYQFASGTTGDKLAFDFNSGASWHTHEVAGALTTNTWTHVAVTYDGTNVQLYKNGNIIGTFAETTPMVANTLPLRIGSRENGTDPFNGKIDNLAIYNRALTDAEIKAHYKNEQYKNSLLGTGADGVLTVSSGTFNLNTQTNGNNGRTQADAVNFTTTGVISAGTTTINLSTAPAGLAAGDEILVINLQGTSADYTNAGNYESVRISGISGSVLTLAAALTNNYGDSAIQKIMVQRVPNYTDVTISAGATLTASAWDGVKGGILFFKANKTVSVSGSIDMSGNGYRAGLGAGSGGYYTGPPYGNQTAPLQPNAEGIYPQNGGGAAGPTVPGQSCSGNANSGAGGGGGGYAAAGTTAATTSSGCSVGGIGGPAYGTAQLSQVFLGSGGGGGAGGTGLQGNAGSGGAGGKGGGVIYIYADTITNNGFIKSNGAAGNPGIRGTNDTNDSGGGGGGGAGGAIYLTANNLTLGTNLVTANGGIGGSVPVVKATIGGPGSAGRIRVNYSAALSGTTNPACLSVTTAELSKSTADNKVYFKTLSALTAGQGSETSGAHSYYVYYGNANETTDAPQNKDNVYSKTVWTTQGDFAIGTTQNNVDITAGGDVTLKTTLGLGDGRDGALNVASGTVNISTQKGVSTYSINQVLAGQWLIEVNDYAGFAVGDEVLIADTRSNSDRDQEIAVVGGISGGGPNPKEITLAQPITKNYETRASITRIPQFTQVDIAAGATLTVNPWNSTTTTGGIIYFKCQGTVTINGTVDLIGKGYANEVNPYSLWNGQALIGTVTEAENLGYGGMRYNSLSGGYGGGRLKIIANTLNLIGNIQANGTGGGALPGGEWQYAGTGGSGGSIYLKANNLIVSGYVSAAGGGGGGTAIGSDGNNGIGGKGGDAFSGGAGGNPGAPPGAGGAGSSGNGWPGGYSAGGGGYGGGGGSGASYGNYGGGAGKIAIHYGSFNGGLITPTKDASGNAISGTPGQDGYADAPGATNKVGPYAYYKTIGFYTPGTIGGTAVGNVGLRVNAGVGLKTAPAYLNLTLASLINGQAIKFRIRTADTTSGLDTATWYGPNGAAASMSDWSSNYFGQSYGNSVSSDILSSSIPNGQYADIIVRLESDGANTPTLNDATLFYGKTANYTLSSGGEIEYAYQASGSFTSADISSTAGTIYRITPTFTLNANGGSGSLDVSGDGGITWKTGIVSGTTYYGKQTNGDFVPGTNLKYKVSLTRGSNIKTTPQLTALSLTYNAATLNNVSIPAEITVGSSPLITWTASGINNVKIEYSSNSGTSYSTIVAATPGAAGTYTWQQVPNDVSLNDCLIRVSAIDAELLDGGGNSLVQAISGTFSIKSVINLISTNGLNGSGVFSIDDLINVDWSNLGTLNNLLLQWSKDGTTWTNIAPNAPNQQLIEQSIKLRANFTTNNASQTPTLLDWLINYSDAGGNKTWSQTAYNGTSDGTYANIIPTPAQTESILSDKRLWRNDYLYKDLLTLNATGAISVGDAVKADVDLIGLVDRGLLRPDLNDLRITAYNRSNGKFEARNTAGTIVEDKGSSALSNDGGGRWLYKKAVSINGSTAGEQTNYQLAIDPQIYDNTGLVGSWHFSEQGAIDMSGNNNNGTVNGATLTAGKFGNALSFNGTSDYVAAGAGSSLDFGWTNSFSIEAYVKTSQAGGQYKVIYSKAAPAEGYLLVIQDGYVELSLVGWWAADRITVKSTIPVNDGAWHHIIGTYDGSKSANGAYVYVDGVRYQNISVNNLITDFKTTDPVRIGGNNGWAYYNGLIDEVKIYNRALSAAEISQRYAAKAQHDYADVRFTNSAGTELPYWQETDTKFWVKVDSIPTAGATIYEYYGNPSATGASNGTNTFDFFDDFSGDLSKWTRVGSNGTGVIENGAFSLTDSSTTPLSAYEAWQALGSFSDPLILELNAMTPEDQSVSYRENMYVSLFLGARHTKHLSNFDHGWVFGSDYTNAESIQANTWYKMKLIFNSGTAKFFVNDIQKASDQTYVSGSSNLTLYAALWDSSGWSTSHAHYDDVRVRKYASPEPIVPVNGIGSEEIAAKSGLDRGVVKGQAISLDGVDDYVSVADSASLQAQMPMTVEAWIKRDAVGEGDEILYKRGNGGNGWWLAIQPDNKIKFTFGNRTDTFSTGTISDTNWHHIAVCVNAAGNVTHYIDGINAGTALMAGAPFNSTMPLLLGAGTDANGVIISYSDLLIDEARISNNVRYSANFIPRQVPFVADSNTMGLWHFDGNAGDFSGRGNNGILNGGPSYTEGDVIKSEFEDKSASSITASISNSGTGPIANANDGNWGNIWDALDSATYPGVTVTLQYPSAFVANRFSTQFTGNNNVVMTLKGSNDNTNWTDIATGINYTGSNNREDFAFLNLIAYSYYRVLFTSATVSCFNSDIREIVFGISKNEIYFKTLSPISAAKNSNSTDDPGNNHSYYLYYGKADETNSALNNLNNIYNAPTSSLWTTKSDFEAGTTRSSVDTIGAVDSVKLIAVDTGTGADGALILDGTTAANNTLNGVLIPGGPFNSSTPLEIDIAIPRPNRIYNFTNVTLQNGAWISHSQRAGAGTANPGVEFRIQGTLTVDAASKINLNGKGWSGGPAGWFSAGEGPGGAASIQGEGPGGGGYGGKGGNGGGVSVGGSALPTTVPNLGSGGAGSNAFVGGGAPGGAGGGAIKILANSISFSGIISAYGLNGSFNNFSGGGGAGGGIYIECASPLTNANNISAIGGSGGGGGAGGRITIKAPSITGTPSVLGSGSGAAGVYTAINGVYQTSGTITGLKINAGTGYLGDWQALSWSGTLPLNTAIKFRTRGADSEANLATATWSGYYTASGMHITTLPAQWLEVELRLESTDGANTPTINDFIVGYVKTPNYNSSLSAYVGEYLLSGNLISQLIAPSGITGWSTINYARNINSGITNLTVDILRGSNDTLIAGNVGSGLDASLIIPKTGSYGWTIGDILGGLDTVKLRLAAPDNSAIVDQSDTQFSVKGKFVISVPTATVSGVNAWTVGDTNRNIVWTTRAAAGALPNVKLQYSPDNGTTWKDMSGVINGATTVANTGSYNWNPIPDNASTNVLIKISDASVKDLAVPETSAGFEIKGWLLFGSISDNNGLKIGTTKVITWTKSNTGLATNVKLQYSPTGSVTPTWKSMSGVAGQYTPAPNSGTYDWTIPDDVSNNVVLRIEDENKTYITALSNTIKIISPTITLLTPNGPALGNEPGWQDKLVVGETYNITWTSDGAVSSNLIFSYSKDDFVSDIISIPATPAQITAKSVPWTIPNDISETVKVRILDNDRPIVLDKSDNYFSIVAIPAINISSPATSAIFNVSAIKQVKWKAGDGVSGTWKLEYSTNGFLDESQTYPVEDVNGSSASNGVYTITADVNGDYIHNWKIPDKISSNIKVRIKDNNRAVVPAKLSGQFIIASPIINVTSPTNASSWIVNTAQNITWTSGEGVSNNWVVEYFIDTNLNGAFDTGETLGNIGTNPQAINPVAGVYTIANWQTADAVSDKARVRVRDSNRLATEGISSVFNIIDPTIAITAPVLNDAFKVGTATNIVWTSTAGVSNTWKLEFSTNGSTYNPLGTDANGVYTITPDGSNNYIYNWTIPDTVSNSITIKIRDNNRLAAPGGAWYSEIFRIVDPIITFSQPTAATVKYLTEPVVVRWTIEGSNSNTFKIEYSKGDFASGTIELLEGAKVITPVGGIYEYSGWSVPNNTNYITPNAKIRVQDALRGNTVNITPAFEIKGANIKLNAPLGNEVFRLGTTPAISWTTAGPVSTNLRLQYYNGSIWKDIANPLPAANVSSKTYSWYIDPTVFGITTAANSGLVKITDKNNIAINNTAPAFTVLNPLITVSKPKVPDTGVVVDECITGEQYNIDWATEGAVSNDLKIDIGTSSDGVLYNYTTLWNGLNPAKPYPWTPTTAGNFVKIKMSDNARANDGGESAVFKVVAAPVVTADTPLVAFVVGTSANTLKWQATEGVSKEWKIEYFIDSDNSGTVNGTEALTVIEPAIIINIVDGDGKYNYGWSIPETFTDISNQIKIKISDTQRSGKYNDISDASFEIAAPSIVIAAPLTLDKLIPGTNFDIKWSVPSGPISKVKIEYSINGAAYSSVTESELGLPLNDGVVTNDGMFTWVVPDAGIDGSNNIKVKISDADRPTQGKSVERQFSIGTPVLTIVSPSGGTLIKGTTVDIVYKAAGNLGDVKILYSGDGGITYNEPADILTASYTDTATPIPSPNNSPGVNNKFSWVINKSAPTTCRIKVVDNTHPNLTLAESALFDLALPTITVSGPLSTDIFVSNETKTIAWTSNGPITDTLKYQYTLVAIPGPSDWVDIAPTATQTVSAAGSGTIDFIVPAVTADNKNVKVRISSISNLANSGTSSAFEVRPAPTITILSPTASDIGADAWVAGISKRVQFASIGRVGQTLEFYYSIDNGVNYNAVPFYTISNYDYTVGLGYYDWTVERAAISNQARVKISGTNLTNGAAISGVSSQFEIARPKVAVNNPIGGEVWAVGDIAKIKWTPTGAVDFAGNGLKMEYMNLDLLGNPISYVTLPNSPAQNTSPYEFNWTIQAGDISGATADKKIRITDNSDIQVKGISPAGFTIIPAPTIDITALTDTNNLAKSQFVVGDIIRVKWDCKGIKISNNLTIELSDDNFTTKRDVTTQAAKTADADTSDGVYSGAFDYTIPQNLVLTSPDNVKIKVYDPANTAISDTFGPVRVTPGFDFTAPLATTEWKAGTVQDIKWNNRGIVSNIKLEYATSVDGVVYTAYTSIKDSYANIPDVSNISSFSGWPVPDPNLANVQALQGALDNPPEPPEFYYVKLKISDIVDPTIKQEQVFKIGYFKVDWKIKDYDLLTLLDELTVKSSMGGVTYWNMTGDKLSSAGRIHSRRYPYGTYTTYWSKSGYIERADSDRLVNDNMEPSILLESTLSAQMEYKVVSNYSYNPKADTLKVNSWVEKKGTLITADDIDLGKGGNAWIKIYDGETLLTTLTSDLPDLNGTYWFDLSSPSGLIKGKTYFAKAGIYYRNREYVSGASFSISLETEIEQVVTDIKVALDEQTVALTEQISDASTTIGNQVSGVATQVAAAETAIKGKVDDVLTETRTNLPAKIADVKSDIGKVLTATETTLPGQLTSVQQTLSKEFDNISVKSQLLTRQTSVKSGSSIIIRYRTNSGLRPEIDVYDPLGVMKVVDAAMTEIGTTGIYEYTLKFESGWGTGDFTIVASEATQGVMDSVVITVMKTDIEDVSGQVSAVLGTTAGLKDEAEGVEEINKQLELIQKALEGVEHGTRGVAPLVIPGPTSSASGTGTNAVSADLTTYYSAIEKIEQDVKGIGELKNYKLEQLHSITEKQTQNIKQLKNKVLELKSMLELNRKLLENMGTQPVVQNWFEWGSVVLKLLAVNPSQEIRQKVPIKAYLPKGVKPEDIIELNDLELLFDVSRGAYYVYKEFELEPGETIMREVRMQDVWKVAEDELENLQRISTRYTNLMQNTDYYDRANFLKNSVESKISEILERQKNTPANPQDHISAYHENLKLLESIRADISASESLVTQATKISPVNTWKLIIVIMAFLGIVSVVFFAVWHRQLKLNPAAVAPLHMAASGGMTLPLGPQRREVEEDKKVEISDIERILRPKKPEE